MRKRGFSSSLALKFILALLLPCVLGEEIYANDTQVPEKICGSIHIRNPIGFSSGPKGTQNYFCTVVEGDFTFMIPRESRQHHIDYESAPHVFPYLREITGHVVIYNNIGLVSLSEMLPELRVIGGEKLIVNYALVVYKNENLEDVGLQKLALIKNGGVWITENPRLCNTRNIDWKLITSSPVAAVRTDEEKYLKKCNQGSCQPRDTEGCRYLNGSISCWTKDSCQKECRHVHDNTTIGPGCDPDGNRCHELCIGGCTRSDDPAACHSCRFVLQNNVCVDRCPKGLYEVQNRRCITSEACYNFAPIRQDRRAYGWKTVGASCTIECPDGFEQDPDEKKMNACVKCDGDCLRSCFGNYAINSLSDAHDIRLCDVIQGNLVINLGTNIVTPRQLEQAFGRVRVVMGHMVVRFSSTFTTLEVFKNLREIGGQIGNQPLYRDRYALAVFENQNLRNAFKPLSIKNGSIMFHNNRVLCYKRILEFQQKSDISAEITEIDVSKVSNGEKAICVEPTMKVSVIAKASDSITLQFPNFNSFNKDERSFIGHQIFYKPVRRAYRNMPYLEEEDSCDSSWKMAFVTPDLTKGPERSELLVNLKPDTMYAFYVKTRMTDLKDHSISKILYIKTRYAIPDPPASLRASSPDPYSIDLTWKAPINPNGKITFYKVSWTIVKPSEAQEGMNHCQSSELAPKSKYNFKVGYDDQDLLDNNATCPAIAGCCNCADLGKKKLNIIPVDWVREAEAVKMENQIQNLIWTKRRKKRAIVPTFLGGRINEDGKATEGEYRVSSISTMGLIIVNETKSILKKLKIKDLYHFTNYRIQIYACQDPKEEGAKCSTESADAMVWTAPKPEFDVINASTVVHLDKEEKNTSRIFWELPATPNGEVLAFRLKFILTDKAPIEYCVTLDDFLANEGALVKNFTLKGDVKLEIRTETTYGRSEPSEVTKLHFKEEGWNLWIWIPLGVCGVVLVVVASIVIQRRYYKKKKEKYPEFYPYETYIADDWELPMDDFEAEKKIGGGSFGDVYKFTMKTKMISHSGYEFTVCAGKVLKSTEKQDRDKFLTEGSMMKKFDSPFVVKLYGIVSMCNPPMVVMEYMDRGNLRDYLRQNRPKGEGLIHMKKPTRKNMLWAAQIADGMAYLHSLNFCHRDLAARNILVSETDTVKIGDFGLSRELGLHDYYRPDSARQLPIRWMAPEALQDGTSTIQSDVWSYAIVLYEILTYGSIPYVGFANEEVKRRVVHKRLAIELPGEVPKDWDALIKACAQYEPSMRPTFKQVVKYVRHKIRDVRFDQVSFTINNDYQDVKPFSFKDFEEQQQPELLPAAMNMTNIFERSQDEIVRKANSLENVENNYFECETDVLLKDLATRAKSF